MQLMTPLRCVCFQRFLHDISSKGGHNSGKHNPGNEYW